MDGSSGFKVIEVDHEESQIAEDALRLVVESFATHERHSIGDLRSEIAEKRLDLLHPFDYHFFALQDPAGRVVGAASGVYLAGVNAGFIAYLAIAPELRGGGHGHVLRDQLVHAFRENAANCGNDPIAWILGEVRADNRWLHRLIREGTVMVFDLEYFYPGFERAKGSRYVLYRQPIGDRRPDLPADEVRRILYAIYRRAYRVPYPLSRENFRDMLAQIGNHASVGLRGLHDSAGPPPS